jgi:hypothetical protein
MVNVKGKIIPLQDWRVPDASRRVRIPDFRVNLHTKVVRYLALSTATFTPQEIFLVLISVRD